MNTKLPKISYMKQLKNFIKRNRLQIKNNMEAATTNYMPSTKRSVGGTIEINPLQARSKIFKELNISPSEMLLHEVGHSMSEHKNAKQMMKMIKNADDVMQDPRRVDLYFNLSRKAEKGADSWALSFLKSHGDAASIDRYKNLAQENHKEYRKIYKNILSTQDPEMAKLVTNNNGNIDKLLEGKGFPTDERWIKDMPKIMTKYLKKVDPTAKKTIKVFNSKYKNVLKPDKFYTDMSKPTDLVKQAKEQAKEQAKQKKTKALEKLAMDTSMMRIRPLLEKIHKDGIKVERFSKDFFKVKSPANYTSTTKISRPYFDILGTDGTLVSNIDRKISLQKAKSSKFLNPIRTFSKKVFKAHSKKKQDEYIAWMVHELGHDVQNTKILEKGPETKLKDIKESPLAEYMVNSTNTVGGVLDPAKQSKLLMDVERDASMLGADILKELPINVDKDVINKTLNRGLTSYLRAHQTKTLKPSITNIPKLFEKTKETFI